MKKWMVIILGVIILLVLFFLLFVRIGGGCDPPKKPNSVPEKAIWKGGCDGGSWIELVLIEKEKARFRIYRDWNGDLLLDADFEYKNCNDFRLTESNWKEHVAYMGEALEIYEKSNVGGCRLIPVYPVFYEEKLE